MIDTTIVMAAASGAIVISAISPAGYAANIGAIAGAVFGGLIVQGWTKEQRKPTPVVMASDIAASAFAGYASKVMGIPTCLALINKFVMPKDAPLIFEPADYLGSVIVIAVIAGMLGSGVIRKIFDKVNPGWGATNGKP